jgi:1-acyl-sn-glycerol-3-phosphate acyltransferase
MGCLTLVRLLFDAQLEGRENWPVAGAIAAGMPHRNWVEPVLLFALLPDSPRQIAIADGPTVRSSRLRRLLIRAGGGVITVEPRSGPSGFARIAEATTAAVDAGAIVVIFPESGPPSLPPALRPLSGGVGHLAARSGAAVVPVVIGGSAELYMRRRLIVRVLPPLDPPRSTSRADISAFMEQLRAAAQAAAVDADRAVESVPVRRKRLRWLSGNYPRAGV